MTSLSEVEYNFLIKKTGRALALNQLRQLYYKSQGAPGNYLGELERNWLRIAISATGGIPFGTYISALWQQLNATLGLKVSRFMNENKRIYFATQ